MTNNYKSPFREINYELESQKEQLKLDSTSIENRLNSKYQYEEIKIDWNSFKLHGDPESIEIPYSNIHRAQGMFPDSNSVPTRKYTFIGKIISPSETNTKELPFFTSNFRGNYHSVFNVSHAGDNIYFSITVQRFSEDEESVRMVMSGKISAIEHLKQQINMLNQSFLKQNDLVSDFISTRIMEIVSDAKKMDDFKNKINKI
jgi:hypothetical protein